MKRDYLSMYEGVKSEILYTTKFNKNSDLGKGNMTRSDNIKAEGKFPVLEQCYTIRK